MDIFPNMPLPSKPSINQRIIWLYVALFYYKFFDAIKEIMSFNASSTVVKGTNDPKSVIKFYWCYLHSHYFNI